MDGEEVIAGAGGGVSSAAALLVAVAVDLAEVAEVGAADARDDVAGEVPDGAVAAAHLEGEVVQGALTVHDEPVLLRAEVPHGAEHLVERPVVRVGHRHQPGEQQPTDDVQCPTSQNAGGKKNISGTNQSLYANRANFNLSHRINIQGAWRDCVILQLTAHSWIG